MLETVRLRLRPWQPTDLAPFRALNADPEVMEFFPAPLTPHQSDELAHRIGAAIAERGWGLFAVERKQDARFLGFIGLADPAFAASFTPCIEIGWRLARDVWGQGIATEGAQAVLRLAFETIGLREVVSFTTENNRRSRRVMEKIGMRHETNFAHPDLVENHPQRPHVLYKLHAAAWAPLTPDRIWSDAAADRS